MARIELPRAVYILEVTGYTMEVMIGTNSYTSPMMFTTIPETFVTEEMMGELGLMEEGIYPDPLADGQIAGIIFALAVDPNNGIRYLAAANATVIVEDSIVINHTQISPEVSIAISPCKVEDIDEPTISGIAVHNYVGDSNCLTDLTAAEMSEKMWIDDSGGVPFFSDPFFRTCTMQYYAYREHLSSVDMSYGGTTSYPFGKNNASLYALPASCYMNKYGGGGMYRHGLTRPDHLLPPPITDDPLAEPALNASGYAASGFHGILYQQSVISNLIFPYEFAYDGTGNNIANYACVCLGQSYYRQDYGIGYHGDPSWFTSWFTSTSLYIPSPVRIMYQTAGRLGLLAVLDGQTDHIHFDYRGDGPYAADKEPGKKYGMTYGLKDNQLELDRPRMMGTIDRYFPNFFTFTRFSDLQSWGDIYINEPHGTMPELSFKVFEYDHEPIDSEEQLINPPEEPVQYGSDFWLMNSLTQEHLNTAGTWRELQFFPLRDRAIFCVPNGMGSAGEEPYYNKNTSEEVSPTLADPHPYSMWTDWSANVEPFDSFIYFVTNEGPFEPPQSSIPPTTSGTPAPVLKDCYVVAVGSNLELGDEIIDNQYNRYYKSNIALLRVSDSIFPHRVEEEEAFGHVTSPLTYNPGSCFDPSNAWYDHIIQNDPDEEPYSFHLEDQITNFGALWGGDPLIVGRPKSSQYDHIWDYTINSPMIGNIPLDGKLGYRNSVPGYVHSPMFFARGHGMVSTVFHGGPPMPMGFTMGALLTQVATMGACLKGDIASSSYLGFPGRCNSISHALLYNFNLAELGLALGSVSTKHTIYISRYKEGEKPTKPEAVFSYDGLHATPHYIGVTWDGRIFIPTDIGILELDYDFNVIREWLHPVLERGDVLGKLDHTWTLGDTPQFTPVFDHWEYSPTDPEAPPVAYYKDTGYSMDLTVLPKPASDEEDYEDKRVALMGESDPLNFMIPTDTIIPTVQADDIYTGSVITLNGSYGFVSNGASAYWMYLSVVLERIPPI